MQVANAQDLDLLHLRAPVESDLHDWVQRLIVQRQNPDDPALDQETRTLGSVAQPVILPPKEKEEAGPMASASSESIAPRKDQEEADPVPLNRPEPSLLEVSSVSPLLSQVTNSDDDMMEVQYVADRILDTVVIDRQRHVQLGYEGYPDDYDSEPWFRVSEIADVPKATIARWLRRYNDSRNFGPEHRAALRAARRKPKNPDREARGIDRATSQEEQVLQNARLRKKLNPREAELAGGL
jgi:hypothetical protein